MLGLGKRHRFPTADPNTMLPSVPFRPQARRERRQLSSPDPPSPLDSGYVSASPLLSTLKRSTKENEWPLAEIRSPFDGNQSNSDDPFADSDREDSLTNATAALRVSSPSQPSPSLLRGRAATLPRRTPRSRLALPASFYSPLDARLHQRRHNTVSVRHLDRFIPARPKGTELSDRFKTNKAPQELSTVERILRHGGATEDAFVYRQRIVTPLGSETRSRIRAETAASRNEGQCHIPACTLACISWLTRLQWAVSLAPLIKIVLTETNGRSIPALLGPSASGGPLLTTAEASYSGAGPTLAFFGPHSQLRNHRMRRSWRNTRPGLQRRLG